MTVTRLDSRQSRQRSSLDQLTNETNQRLDVLLSLINDELTMPLRLSADTISSQRLNIAPIEIQTLEGGVGTGRKRTIAPFAGKLPSFTSGYITFPTATNTIITATGPTLAGTYTIPSGVINHYIKVLVSINTSGQVVLSNGDPASTIESATLPAPQVATYPVGYVIFQYTTATSINTVQNANIRQFTPATTNTMDDAVYVVGDQTIAGQKTFTGAINQKYPYGKKQPLITKAKSGLYKRSEAVTAATNWIPRTAPGTNNWTSISWSPELGLFAAVAYNGASRVMTSPDGVNWTTKAISATSWQSICWSAELGLFVAVSSAGITNSVCTSADGETWTPRAGASGTNYWNSVCWSAELGLFVAVANTGTNRVMTSPDGITWTARVAAAANQWLSVCWSAELGLFIAVSIDGTNRAMTSSNGVTWTSRAILSSDWTSVCWSPELGILAAVADAGTNQVSTTPSLGQVTAGNQTIAGNKVFTGNLNVSGTVTATNFVSNYTAVTEATTLNSSHSYVSATGTSNYAITLPNAVGILGQVYVIKSNMNPGVILTVNTTSSQTIDGAMVRSLARFDSLQVISNNSNWEVF